MLPFETESHAKALYRNLCKEWVAKNEAAPDDPKSRALAEAAVAMATGFTAALNEEIERTYPAERKPEIVTPVPFRAAFDDWHRFWLHDWEESARRRVRSRFERYVLPVLGSRLIAEIHPAEILQLLKRVEDAGYLPLAHLLLGDVVRVYKYAICCGWAASNPAVHVKSGLFRRRPKRHPTVLLPSRIGDLLRAIDNYRGQSPMTVHMMRLLPMVFVRAHVLRTAEWSEIDFRDSLWRIPGQKMKNGRPHLVPLSRQAKKVLLTLRRLTGEQHLVFLSSRTETGLLDVKNFSAIFARLGFSGEMTTTGIRSMASTILSGQGWSAEAIERQLSHVDPRSMRRTYNFAEYMPERRRMMQAWADYLDTLKRAVGKDRTRTAKLPAVSSDLER